MKSSIKKTTGKCLTPIFVIEDIVELVMTKIVLWFIS